MSTQVSFAINIHSMAHACNLDANMHLHSLSLIDFQNNFFFFCCVYWEKKSSSTNHIQGIIIYEFWPYVMRQILFY